MTAPVSRPVWPVALAAGVLLGVLLVVVGLVLLGGQDQPATPAPCGKPYLLTIHEPDH